MKLRLTILAIVILSTFAFAGSASAPFASHRTASAQTVADDKTALTAFYNATGGANWTNNTDWHGVDTNDDGRVITLVLSNNNLTGSIPAEIGKLSNLDVLLLQRNQLTGSIPAEIGNLSELAWLFLQVNQLSGSIPTEIGNLSNLAHLGLGGNQLTGSIPAEIGNLSRLQQLGFEYNELTGSVPAELGNLSNLWRCTLATIN